MKKLVVSAIAALSFAATAASTQAADIPARVEAQPPAPIEVFNPWMIRVRAIGVLPESSARIRAGGVLIPGASAKISNSVVPEVDITYFFSRNLAVEAICCVTPHRIKATGAIAALGRIGSTLVFPPTVLLQYHFTNFGAFKPNVGVGVNYTHYFNNSAGPLFANLKIRDSWGVAAQIGFDYMIDKHWGINFDVKRIYMQPNARVTLLPALPIRAKVKIDPWIIGAGVTYKF